MLSVIRSYGDFNVQRAKSDRPKKGANYVKKFFVIESCFFY